MITNPNEKSEDEAERKDHLTLSQKWVAFIDNTTLHGIRNVVPSQRPYFSRMIWSAVMLFFGAYFIFTFYQAVHKYLQYHTVTLITQRYEQKMQFPAVSICPNNLFSKAKIMMQDNDPRFAAQGLNMSACAATRDLRQTEMDNMACGLAMICCCAFYGRKTDPTAFPNCTKQRRSALLKAIEKSGAVFNMEEFFKTFSPDLEEMVTRYFLCHFQWYEACNASDFEAKVTPYGLCYTFNPGKKDRSKYIYLGGVSSGLGVLLNVNQADYMFVGKVAQGVSISIHAQGESFNGYDALSVMPGTYATISLSEQRFEYLERYGQKCKNMTLKSFSLYTMDGCLEDCFSKHSIDNCGCRLAGRIGSSNEVCSQKHADCIRNEMSVTGISRRMTRDFKVLYYVAVPFYPWFKFYFPLSLGTRKCECPVPCSLKKYKAEISYSNFPNQEISSLLNNWYGYPSDQRQDFVFVTVGFKSLSYELQKEKLVYDIYAMFVQRNPDFTKRQEDSKILSLNWDIVVNDVPIERFGGKATKNIIISGYG